MSKWQTVKLGDFLNLYRIEHRVQDQTIYKQVTISKTKGVFFRGEKQGKNIGRKRQFLIDLDTYPNTLLFTRQGVFDGSIGIAPIEVNQCIVTENMPMMSIDTSIVEIEYLKKLLISEYLFEKIRKLKIVGSAQKSIHERDLLKIEIELPDKSEQVEICKKFNTLDIEHNELTGEISNQQNLLKKLRQQILQDAIEGKLTKDWREQNPDIEPASELLKRIEDEKQQLIKDKKIKKQKSLPAITETEKPFALPDGWALCRLWDLINISSGDGLTSSNMKEGKIPVFGGNGITGYHDKPNTYKVTVTIGRVGAYCGAVHLTPELAWITDNCFKVWFSEKNIDIEYLVLHLKQMKLGELAFKGSQPVISGKRVYPLITQIPPLEEQEKIVKKVEKLFAICDQLEAQITSSQNNAEQLMQSVLKEAFSQSDAA